MPLAALGGMGIAALIGGGASIGGALIGSNAASNAADAQSAAANHAADLNYSASQNALNFQEQQWNQQQANMAPWLNTGRAGLSQLGFLMGLDNPGQSPVVSPGMGMQSGTGVAPTGGSPSGPTPLGISARPASGLPLADPTSGSAHMLGPVMSAGGVPGSAIPTAPVGSAPSAPSPSAPSTPSVGSGMGGFGSLMQANPYATFTPPTGLTMENDPGYQARMKLGTDAVQRSAAARGSLLTGGTAQALNQFGQDYGSNEYSNVYNRAFNTNAANYNAFNQGKTDQFNRLAAISGMGQQSAQQLGYLGNQAAQGVTSNLLSTAQNMGQQYNNAAAANASGIVGGANAWGGALGGIGNSLSQLYLLNSMNKGGFGGGFSSSTDGFQGMGA